MKNAVTMILEYVEYKHRIEPYMEELAHLFPGEEPCTDDELLREAWETKN